MVTHLLTIKNFYWAGDAFCPALALGRASDKETVAPADVRGRFACACADEDGSVTLTRDRLGLSKLFLSVHETGTVVTASYLIDLVRRGVPLECVYSVPAGHVVRLDPRGRIEASRPFAESDQAAAPCELSIEGIAQRIRRQLDVWFARMAAQCGHRKIRVCLSGGLDSGIIAAFARKYFTDVTGYTYSYMDGGASPSDDANSAERLAEALRIPLRIVPASADDVMGAIEDALCYGQDWRDFNVHCAIVNEILARAIRRDANEDGPGSAHLVLTGDLANELLADYSPVPYTGREFYTLPDVDPATLRLMLVRGLDAGDREVGIFGRYDLDLVQPYSLIADEYMRLPASFIANGRSKQVLARLVAGDMLPEFVLERIKVRAQIGTTDGTTGILPLLIENGRDVAWLRRTFARLFRVEDEAFLSGFIRAGRYRVVNRLSAGKSLINGYIAA